MDKMKLELLNVEREDLKQMLEKGDGIMEKVKIMKKRISMIDQKFEEKK